MWNQTTGRAYPPWAALVPEFLGLAMHHPTQISLAEFAASHLRDKIFNLDMLSIARTTKLHAESAVKAEDETVETEPKAPAVMETEFHGGEGAAQEELEDENQNADRVTPCHAFDVDVLSSYLQERPRLPPQRKKGAKNMLISR